MSHFCEVGMMDASRSDRLRILVFDDEAHVLELYREFLSPNGSSVSLDLRLCERAEDAVAAAKEAMQNEDPFAVAFVDLYVPGKFDGLWAAEEIRTADPEIEIVIVTACIDISPEKISERVPPVEKLLYLRKPFFAEELRQLAISLGAKWRRDAQLTRVQAQLEAQVKSRTAELVEINEKLTRQLAMKAKIEAELNDREQRYRILFENAADLIAVIDPRGTLLDLNKRFEEESGYSREEMIGTNVFTTGLLTESSIEKARRHLEEVLGGKESATFEIEGIPKDGAIVPYELKAVPIMQGGELVAIQTTLRNITERRRAEEALRESEELFRSIVASSHAGIFTIDDNYRFLYVNDELCRIGGLTREEVVGADFRELLDGEALELVTDRYVRRLEGKAVPSRYEFSFVRKDGERKVLEMSAAAIKDSAGKSRAIGQVLDVTERKKAQEERHKLEAQLRHAQKMEAVGILAGGIAHDFNNLLQAIQGYADLLLLDREKSGRGYEELQQILRATHRGSELVRQLLTFSRKVESKLRPIDLNREIQQTEKLLVRAIPRMIEIELHLAEGLKIVHADSVQLEQVLMNLAVNSKEAMPEGGKLTIGTRNVHLDKDYCDDHLGAKPGHYALLTVTDTGQGMDKATLAHIFEPFFTTKDLGRGTGLGLATVYGIVKNHGGYIMCYSEVGQGTTFKMYLPVVEQVPEETYRPQVDPMVAGGDETILLVDDEESVREMGRRMLEHFGYEVLSAPDGETAVLEYGKRTRKIDLIVLDLIMPGMGGRRCLDELLWINPRAKVLIASGHAMNDSVKESLAAGAKGFVGKPYELNQLLRAIREILDQGGNHA
jgi:two-component system cell cycle sensor histidine kinase/response regulator CckA